MRKGSWFVLVLLAAAVVTIAVWRRRRPRTDGDEVPMDPRPRDALIDEASDESFPASDPPSYWGRGAEPAS